MIKKYKIEYNNKTECIEIRQNAEFIAEIPEVLFKEFVERVLNGKNTIISDIEVFEIVSEIQFQFRMIQFDERATKLRSLSTTLLVDESEKVPTQKIINPPVDHFPVIIYLADDAIDLFTSETITNACGDFMETLGYELDNQNEPIYGSFLKKMIFKIKEGRKRIFNEVNNDFLKGKKALEMKYVDLPTAEQTEKLAESALKIVQILEKQENAVIRLGAILAVKKTKDGKADIKIQQLNWDILLQLDNQPSLFQDVDFVYKLLTAPKKELLEEDDTQIIM